jgi:hypothetical protein
VKRRPEDEISNLPADDQDNGDWAEILTEAASSGKHGEYGDEKDLGPEYPVSPLV